MLRRGGNESDSYLGRIIAAINDQSERTSAKLLLSRLIKDVTSKIFVIITNINL